MHDLGPSYLKELLIPNISKRTLRSTTANVPSLVIPRVKLKYGERSLSYSGPFIWNNLPIEVRSANTVTAFKGRLKTYLFTCAYPNWYFFSWHLSHQCGTIIYVLISFLCVHFTFKTISLLINFSILLCKALWISYAWIMALYKK